MIAMPRQVVPPETLGRPAFMVDRDPASRDTVLRKPRPKPAPPAAAGAGAGVPAPGTNIPIPTPAPSMLEVARQPPPFPGVQRAPFAQPPANGPVGVAAGGPTPPGIPPETVNTAMFNPLVKPISPVLAAGPTGRNALTQAALAGFQPPWGGNY